MNTKMISQLNILHKNEEEHEYLGKNKKVNMLTPLVSICVSTYQHNDYIKYCINSILMQETDFPYEIIIGEDQSTDGTREICIDFALKHPDKIRLYLRNRKTSQYYENKKFIARFNGIWCRMSARGKYIALCEGDDYWTDPKKLQNQVDFLNTNEDYILTCGGYTSQYLGRKKDIIQQDIVSKKQESSKGFTFLLDDLTKDYMTKTLTVLFRNKKDMWSELAGYHHNRDIHIYYHLLKLGKGYYFKKILGVYNIHSGGIYSLNSNYNRLRDHYYLYQELYKENNDNYPRTMYLRMCLDLINYKIYSSRSNPEFRILMLLNQSRKLIKNRFDIFYFIKSLLPR